MGVKSCGVVDELSVDVDVVRGVEFEIGGC